MLKHKKNKKRLAGELAKRRQIEYELLSRHLMKSPIVQKMGNYIQHGNTTTLEHCKDVAWVSYLINQKLKLKADPESLIKTALLHDFYLYDWHDGKPQRKTHGFDHPEIAAKNAKKFFNLTEKELDAIKSHMWPLNFFPLPKTREGIIICLADKYCAGRETIMDRVKAIRKKVGK